MDLQILEDEPLARYTSARIGGPADRLTVVRSVEALIEALRTAHKEGLAWRVLGSGSNLLVADAGVRAWVIVNQAKQVVFKKEGRVYAEAGAKLSSLARNCISRGLAGLEWAVGIPGTVGGAVVGNAGAHGGDIAAVLETGTILESDGSLELEIVEWPLGRFKYGYRDSVLKHRSQSLSRVVLAATFALTPGDPSELARRASVFVARREAIQPAGTSMGSTFKNPPGDHAGRLIEAAGLKGARIGGAQISPLHANFIVNTGNATAADVKALVDLAQERVQERFGVGLELEIELVGEWGV